MAEMVSCTHLRYVLKVSEGIFMCKKQKKSLIPRIDPGTRKKGNTLHAMAGLSSVARSSFFIQAVAPCCHGHARSPAGNVVGYEGRRAAPGMAPLRPRERLLARPMEKVEGGSRRTRAGRNDDDLRRIADESQQPPPRPMRPHGAVGRRESRRAALFEQ
jgi:hypothetical protein